MRQAAPRSARHKETGGDVGGGSCSSSGGRVMRGVRPSPSRSDWMGDTQAVRVGVDPREGFTR